MLAAALLGVVVVVADAAMSGAQTPTAPDITSGASATFEVGSASSFDVTVTGDPTPSVFESGTLPKGVSFSNGVFSGTPASGVSGLYAITIVASNSVSPDAIQSFTLTVEQAPAITSGSNTIFTVGVAATFIMNATGEPPPTFSEVGSLPEGIALSSLGVLSGTAPTGTDGSYPITVTASNGAPPAASQNFTLVVATIPAITSSNTTTFTVGSDGTFTFTATGDPAPKFAESGGLPSGVTLSSAGVLSGTPAASAAGIYQLTVTAENGASTSATQNFTLDVMGPPVITSADEVGFVEGMANSFTVRASGDPAPTLSEIGTLPGGVSFNTTTGVLSSTSSLSGTGSYPITFEATNGLTPSASQSLTLLVGTVPEIASPISTVFVASVAGSFAVTTTGYPTPHLSVTGALPGFVTFVDNGDGTGTFSGTVLAKRLGAYHVVITAKSLTGTVTQSFTIFKEAVPVIKSASSASFTVGQPGVFKVRSVNYPRNTLTITAGSLPNGLKFADFGDDTAFISGTPQAGTDGTYPLTLRATNQAGSTTQSFTLTVDS